MNAEGTRRVAAAAKAVLAVWAVVRARRRQYQTRAILEDLTESEGLLQTAGWQAVPEGVFIARERHVRALHDAGRHLDEARALISAPMPALELLAEELRLAVGSPAWIAPEQVVGVRGDPRSDVFAIGVMLYQLCTEELPFGEPQTNAGLRQRRGQLLAWHQDVQVTGQPSTGEGQVQHVPGAGRHHEVRGGHARVPDHALPHAHRPDGLERERAERQGGSQQGGPAGPRGWKPVVRRQASLHREHNGLHRLCLFHGERPLPRQYPPVCRR